MKSVIEAIEAEAHTFAAHEFFELMRGEGTVAELRAVTAGLTFFVLAFQDLLRINESRIEDECLRELAHQQRIEDLGHERWLLADQKELGSEPSLEQIFSTQSGVFRDVAFELISEVFRADHDATRLAIPLAMEASGRVSLPAIARYFSGCGHASRFFSQRHVEIEAGHDIHQTGQLESLQTLAVPGWAEVHAISSVRRIFLAKIRMMDQLAKLVRGATTC